MNAYTENVISVRFLKFNIADSLGIGADADCMFVVVNKLIAGNAHFGKRIKERIDRTVPPAHHILRFAVHSNYAGKNRRVVVILFFVLLINKMALDDFVFSLQVDKLFLEEFHDLQFVQFITVRIRRSFDGVPAISIGDAGYTSGASPTFRDWSSLNKYMTIVPYAKFNDAEKQQASDPARWHCTDQEGTFNLEELRTGSEAGHLSRCYYKDLCNDSQRTILVYSIYQMEQILAQRAFNTSHGSLMKIRENSSDELIGGITAIVTNILDVDAPELISLYNMRTDDLERCRILSMEADEINEDLTLDESIRAHFIICFSANVVFASLMHKMNSRGEGRDVAQQLRDMQFMKIQSEGYVPLYTRSDLTDRLHEAIGFRTDYEIISTRQMNRLVRNKL